MPRVFVFWITALMLAASAATAEDKPAPSEKEMSGMSVLGNDDAPKALVIVPWKSSVLGDTLSVPRSLDDGLQPVDRDVFLRELAYYRIRAASDGGSERSAP
ncbi:MAG TPA: hypothetical protein VII78_17390 [Myxococcota bacterium]